jgi:hypothetical protein
VDRYTAIVAVTALITGGVVLAMLGQAIASVYANRRKRSLTEPGLVRIEERLSRIEQAIDAVSVEVERISEGQRFTSKLLADRHAERIGPPDLH